MKRALAASSVKPKPADSEKITINLGFVDLGQIDLLVAEGFYGNRTDFIRTAIRQQLSHHSDALKQAVARKMLVLGLQHFSADELRAVKAAKHKLQIRVLGLATIAPDVSPELALATIDSLDVLGALHASPAVRPRWPAGCVERPDKPPKKDSMNDTLLSLMRQAKSLTQAGRLSQATAAIQRALAGAAAAGTVPPSPSAWSSSAARCPASATAPSMVLDGCVFDVDTRPGEVAETGRGKFTAGVHTHASLSRHYKLYVPPGQAGRRRPLVVMLHGCTQDPDDFAAGTGMNLRACEQGLFVLYPAQAEDANPSRCWNWFQPGHQQRDRGEPASISSMTSAVLAEHGIDASRVYIAGLSAGGAMAAIVAGAYPDIFAALGVHSGLPSGAASDLAGALAVMKRGLPGPDLRSGSRRLAALPEAAAPPPRPLPTIVFHGDQDRTVHSRNGEQLIAAALGRAGGSPAGPAARVEQGTSAQGRRYTRRVHLGDQGQALAEHWLLHGAGHAWSGGDASGTYTDAKGPDATREMLRFFLEHPKAPMH